jgi:hypothetical protein
LLSNVEFVFGNAEQAEVKQTGAKPDKQLQLNKKADKQQNADLRDRSQYLSHSVS